MKQRIAWMTMFAVAVLALAASAWAADPANVAGKWNLKMQSPRGERVVAVTFEQDGANLKGTMAGPRGGEVKFDGKVEGNKISFTIKRETPRGTFEQTYKGTVEGDTMKGTVSIRDREQDWTAERAKE